MFAFALAAMAAAFLVGSKSPAIIVLRADISEFKIPIHETAAAFEAVKKLGIVIRFTPLAPDPPTGQVCPVI